MRFSLIAIFLTVVGLAAAWTKEDYEIFDLVSALEDTEGKGTTFYSLLDIDSGASQAQITKAYRKKSLQMHPDKNPGVKNIHDRFARLGVITAILRSPEGRERYNFFYKNGVPKWRGTGYYYSRYRPTLSHTLIFIAFLSSLAQRLVMQLNYNKDKRRVEYFERSARSLAGGSIMKKVAEGEKVDLKGVKRRKVRVPMIEGNEGAGSLELIVEGENVFLPHAEGTPTPLSDLAVPPSLVRLWPIRLSLAIIRRTTAFLPPDIQAKLPPLLLSIPHITSASENHAPTSSDSDTADVGPDTPTPISGSRKNRLSQIKKQERLQGKKGNSNGGGGSASVTETEDDEDEEEEEEGDGGVVSGSNGTEEKKRKSLGKAGGARRRKMAMKK